METINGKILSTTLGYEDHGIFTFCLHLDFGGSGQGAGSYALDSYRKDLGKRVGTASGMDMIIAILNTVGVETWEELKGKYIRVKHDGERVHAIGNLLEEKWLNFPDFYDKRGREI